MVHLQLQPNLEAKCTIRAMKRTFVRVGTPKVMISDNHKTYRSSAVRAFASQNLIKWRHILELPPHWGGFYDRMNRMIKNALRKLLKRARLTYEELDTVVTEIEAALNSRPLSYVDNEELIEPLTPSHLMYGRRLKSPIHYEQTESESISPAKRTKYINTLLERFWKMFNSVYLTSLRERKRKGSESVSVYEGQVVLIQDRFMSRNEWSLGKITRVIKGPDGVPKGAELRTSSGIYKRPLNLLCPLELGNLDENTVDNVTVESNQILVENSSPSEVNHGNTIRNYTRERRAAAKTGEKLRRINDGVNW